MRRHGLVSICFYEHPFNVGENTYTFWVSWKNRIILVNYSNSGELHSVIAAVGIVLQDNKCNNK